MATSWVWQVRASRRLESNGMPSEERKTSMRANCGRWHKGVDVRRMLVSCQRTTVVSLVITHAYTLIMIRKSMLKW
jgi:hypothetical protein